jgi:hypothetical protein
VSFVSGRGIDADGGKVRAEAAVADGIDTDGTRDLTERGGGCI